jgi:hypothetical protein
MDYKISVELLWFPLSNPNNTAKAEEIKEFYNWFDITLSLFSTNESDINNETIFF